jgi:hypothetical protein
VRVLSIRVSLDPLNPLGTTYVIWVVRITMYRRESRVLKGKREEPRVEVRVKIDYLRSVHRRMDCYCLPNEEA